MPRARDGWETYRFRRALFVVGLVGAVAALTLGMLLEAGTPAILALVLASGFYSCFTGVWLLDFPCPACENNWFGEATVAPSLPEHGRRNALSLVTQKLCSHCGLPKFMDPTGWNASNDERAE